MTFIRERAGPVLIICEDAELSATLSGLLQGLGASAGAIHTSATVELGAQLIREVHPTACLVDVTDHNRDAISGLDAIRSGPSTQFILLEDSNSDGPRLPDLPSVAERIDRTLLSGEVLERSLRHATERARRIRAEVRFEALTGVGREILAILDVRGRLRYLSDSVERILGFRPDQHMGAEVLDVVHPDDRERVSSQLREVRATRGARSSMRARAQHSEGGWRIFDVMAENRLHDPVERGIVVSAWDVTELIEQRDQIRMQSTLLDAVGQALIATDLEGQITYWNSVAERLYGWSRAEALGRRVVELTPADENRDRAEEIMVSLARGEPWTGEFKLRRADGSMFPALVTNSPILDDDGTPVGIIGASSDISSIKEIEIALRERVKELKLLNKVTRVLNRREIEMEERLQTIVNLIPGGWLEPDNTEARITVGGQVFQTSGFQETPWSLRAPISTQEGASGNLEVVLVARRPDRGHGPFLPEELELLETLARNIEECVARDRLHRRLTQTIDSLVEAVLVIGPGHEPVIQNANRAAERIFGYPHAELIAQSPELLFENTRDFERFWNEEREAHGRGESALAGYPMRRADGTSFEAIQTASSLNPDSGPARGVVLVVGDLSATEKARRELAESEQRFRQITERIDDVFWVSSTDKSTLEYISPAFESIWGRAAEEIYRADADFWMESIHPDDRERVNRYVKRQAVGEQEAEYRIVRPDGSIRWIHDRSFPVRDEDGATVRVVGVATDITERRRVEERLSVLGRQITDVIYILHPDGTVAFVTESVESGTGYPRDEFEALNAFDLVHPEDRSEVWEAFSNVLEGAVETARAEYRFIRKDGEERHVESLAQNFVGQPGLDGIVITTRDITERRELERALHLSQRLEAIGRLAGGIAHDFNNLLTIIRSQASLLLLDLPEDTGLAEEIRVIQNASDRAARLTSQLLAFSREQILRPRVVKLCDVVAKMADMVGRVIGEQVQLITDFPRDLPSAELDPGQLEQVILNLAINARDAMPDGGILELSTFHSPGGPAGRGFTTIQVRDTGTGMDEATRARIFEPFFTTKSESGGTGLGLAMAYGFVRQSGGTIEVDSSPGEGTTFTLRFPSVDASPSAIEEQSTGGGAAKGTALVGRILLVEDDDAVRRVAVRILERSGLAVVAVDDAETALEELAREDAPGVDGVVTDLGLPGMSGRVLIDELHIRYPGLPVVLMSGYAADSPGRSGVLPPELPFVPKPFTPDDLVQTVREALDRPGRSAHPTRHDT